MLSNSIYIPNQLFFAEVQAQIRQGKKVKIRVRGNSMLPFIRNNDEALLIPPTPEHIQKGTPVVALTDELGIVLHRIYKIKDEQIILRGDGNLRGQEVCRFEDIIGRVVRLKGRGGKRKRLTKARMWRHTPTCIKWLVLKVYSKIIKLQNIFYED